MPDWGVDTREKWALDQIQRSHLQDHIAGPAVALLKTWSEIHHTPETRDLILSVFTELAKDHALPVQDEYFDWVPVKPGQIRVAEDVRVKVDAYAGELGLKHNGRMGRIVAIRSGDIIINTTDGEPKLESVHHSPYALDKKVPRYTQRK